MDVDTEFAALLEEYSRAGAVYAPYPPPNEHARQMLNLCQRILANRLRGGKEAGAHYWHRQVRYWEKEATGG